MAKSFHDTTESTALKEPNKHDAKHDQNGGEIGNPVPLEPPLGYKRSLSLSEQIAQQVRIQTLRILEDQAIHETDDEADDFEVGEDYEPLSQHENDHMPSLANLKKLQKQINDKIEKRKLELAIEDHKTRIEKHEKKVGAAAPTNTDSEPPAN